MRAGPRRRQPSGSPGRCSKTPAPERRGSRSSAVGLDSWRFPAVLGGFWRFRGVRQGGDRDVSRASRVVTTPRRTETGVLDTKNGAYLAPPALLAARRRSAEDDISAGFPRLRTPP